VFILSTIFVFVIWIGVYPNTFLKISAKSSQLVIQQVTNNIHSEIPSAQLLPVKSSGMGKELLIEK